MICSVFCDLVELIMRVSFVQLNAPLTGGSPRWDFFWGKNFSRLGFHGQMFQVLSLSGKASLCAPWTVLPRAGALWCSHLNS